MAVPSLEALYEPRYDQKSILTTTTRMLYFDTAGVLQNTNVEKQNSIASPKFFEIYELNWKVDKATAIADLALLGEVGFLRLTVGSKDYLVLGLRYIPMGTYIYGQSDVGAAAATHFAFGYGWPGFHERYPLWVAEEAVDSVSKRRQKTGNKLPIVLPPEQRFAVTLEFASLAALAATVDTSVVLWGTLFREVQ
jgi:hypothetical protein